LQPCSYFGETDRGLDLGRQPVHRRKRAGCKRRIFAFGAEKKELPARPDAIVRELPVAMVEMHEFVVDV
jgi:hypothetical protein